MKAGSWEIDLESVLKKLDGTRIKIIGLQVPEGLKRHAINIAEFISEKTGKEVMLSGETCYGACDIDEGLLDQVDLLLHLGHSKMQSFDKVCYLEIESDLKLDFTLLDPHLECLKELSPLRLVATVQYLHHLELLKTYLGNNGIESSVGAGDPRVSHRGQILGCNFSAAYPSGVDINGLIFVGTGKFHPSGLAFSSRMPVFHIDPQRSEVSRVGFERLLRKRYALLSSVMDARTAGIIVSRKRGQRRLSLAKDLVAKARENGFAAHIIYISEVRPDMLEGHQVDVFVNTACPRIAIDDGQNFSRPLITPQEFLMLIGEHDLSDYRMDEITGVD